MTEIDYGKIRRNAAKIGRDAYYRHTGEMLSWRDLQMATDAAISFYNASLEDVSEQLKQPDELTRLREERVQLQGENESLRADLEALRRTNDTLLDDLRIDPTARDKTDIETLCERLAKVEDRLAGAFTTDTLRKRFDEIATVLKAHEECLTTNLGYPKRQPLTPEQRDTFGRGDEVRLDMAQSQGGKRIFGWYVVEQLGTSTTGFTVQVSPTEDRDTEPKRLFWIKPDDVLEVRHPTR